MFPTKTADKTETHIYIYIQFFNNSIVCEIMLKNIVDPDGP